MKLCILTNSSVDFKHDNSFLKFQSKNTQGDFGPKFIFFLEHGTLHVGNFEGVDFKYDIILVKFLSKNTQITHFLF